MLRLHATCVDLDGAGLLLRGPSGSGKSDLALRLIESGARLVADDLVTLTKEGGALRGHAPERLVGCIEARGVGILVVPFVTQTRVLAVVDLVPRAAVERLPEPQMAEILGVSVPRWALCAFDASTPAKLRWALGMIAAGEPLVPGA